MPLKYLIDTNVLLRLASFRFPQNSVATRALSILIDQDHDLFFTLQNAAEFWNVCTRAPERNGLGLSIAETEHGLAAIEENAILPPDSSSVYRHWRTICLQHSVRGVQVRDAKLAAAMLAHDVPNILTFNTGDFSRYPGITAVHPKDIQP